MSQLLKVIDTIVTHIFFGQLEFLLIGTGSYIFVCEATEIKESITIANYVVGAIHMMFDDLLIYKYLAAKEVCQQKSDVIELNRIG